MKFGNNLNIFIDRRFLVNSYLLVEEYDCIAIDPGLNEASIDNFIKEHKLKLLAIILTHAHYDHIGNSFNLARKYDVNVYLHRDEKPIIEKHHFAKELNMQVNIDYSLIKYFHNDVLSIGKLNFKILHLKGHTPGGVALKYKKYIFSGDTIFYDSIGRTDLTLGDPIEMQQSLKKFIKFCNDDDWIFPGHGPNGQWTEIKNHNPFIINII